MDKDGKLALACFYQQVELAIMYGINSGWLPSSDRRIFGCFRYLGPTNLRHNALLSPPTVFRHSCRHLKWHAIGANVSSLCIVHWILRGVNIQSDPCLITIILLPTTSSTSKRIVCFWTIFLTQVCEPKTCVMSVLLNFSLRLCTYISLIFPKDSELKRPGGNTNGWLHYIPRRKMNPPTFGKFFFKIPVIPHKSFPDRSLHI